MAKFKLNKKEKNVLRRMLYVFECELRKQPSWASDYLRKLWDADIEDAKCLVEKLTTL